VSAQEGEGAVENTGYASKVPIGRHLVPISLKIIDCVTSFGRTKLKNIHPLKQLKARLG